MRCIYINNQLIVVTDSSNLILNEVKDKTKKLEQLINKIRGEYLKTEKAKLNSAFLLLQIYDYELYSNDSMSYKSIYDFAGEVFGLAKSTVSECLTVARRFGKYDIDDSTGLFIPTYKVLDEYKDFNFSQLLTLRSMSDEFILDNINPTMTVKQIKEIISNETKKLLADNSKKSKDTDPEGDSGSEGSEGSGKSKDNPSDLFTFTVEELSNAPFILPKTNKGYVISLNDGVIKIEYYH